MKTSRVVVFSLVPGLVAGGGTEWVEADGESGGGGGGHIYSLHSTQTPGSLSTGYNTNVIMLMLLLLLVY